MQERKNIDNLMETRDSGGARGPGRNRPCCRIPSGRPPTTTAEDLESASAGAFDPSVRILRSVVREMSIISADELHDEELRTAVSDVLRVMSSLEAVWLGMVRSLDGRPGAVAGARDGRIATTFLMERCRRSPSRACADVRAAHAIDPGDGELPVLGRAFSAGETSREHLDVAVRALHRLPKHLRKGADGSGEHKLEILDEFLTEKSLSRSPTTTDRLMCQTLAVIDPSGQERRDNQARERRELTTALDSTGMLQLRGQLDPVGGAVVRTAIEHFSRTPVPEGDNGDGGTDPQAEAGRDRDRLEGVVVRDCRTTVQRNADALVMIARIAMTGTSNPRRPTPAQLLVMATPEQVAEAQKLDGGDRRTGSVREKDPGNDTTRTPDQKFGGATCLQTGAISTRTLGRFLCDSVMQRVLVSPGGTAVDLGRKVRTASTAQRKMLILRDGGCVVPGCGASPNGCEIHHVEWFRNGGATNLDNMVMLCPFHHDHVHDGTWELRKTRGGAFLAVPPRWIDPMRRPLPAVGPGTNAVRSVTGSLPTAFRCVSSGESPDSSEGRTMESGTLHKL